MEEKILITSEKMNMANFLIRWLAIATAIFFVASCLKLNPIGVYYRAIGIVGMALLNKIIIPILLGGFSVLPAIVFYYFAYKKIELIVTNKRVYGFAAFGKRVDLPMDSITAISTSMLKGIGVSTASGRIKFAFIKNRDEIQQVLSKQIMNRQNTSENKAPQEEKTGSNIIELKQYKELLDTGVITQEEFEKKKEQLLKQ